jgi:hypothetical protein
MNQLQSLVKCLCVTAALACVAKTTVAQNLVVDGGFEMSPAPNFHSAWTLSPPGGGGPGQQFSNVGTDPLLANSGNHHANLAPAFEQTGSLSQVLNTTAGVAYNLSFALANFSTLPVNFFQVFFNNVLVFSTMSPPFATGLPYQQFNLNGLLATGPTTTLEFRYRHDDDFWYLDDVSVTDPSGTGVPETGATLWLALPMLAGVCFVHFRLRARAAAAS